MTKLELEAQIFADRITPKGDANVLVRLAYIAGAQRRAHRRAEQRMTEEGLTETLSGQLRSAT